ncbi:MAG: S41 family peptidase [Acidobacteriota bacterium]
MKRRALDFATSILLLALATPAICEVPASAPGPHIARLAAVGKLWGFVRYLHPYLAYRDIDWDAALIAAIPRIRDARSAQEYAAAVQGMLDALADPMTKIIPAPQSQQEPEVRPPTEVRPPLRQVEEGIIAIDLGASLQRLEPMSAYNAVLGKVEEIDKAKALIVDLRLGQEPTDESYMGGYILEHLASHLVSHPCHSPAQRYLMHSGYAPQDGTTSGGYFSAFLTMFAQSFSPSGGVVAKRVVFVLDRSSEVPPIALALQAAGDGRIVVAGELDESAVVATQTVPIGEGLTAQVRVSEILPEASWHGFHADIQLPDTVPGGHDAAFASALDLARKGWAAAPQTSAADVPYIRLPDAVFRPDKTYPEMLAPDLASRQLAVIRGWTVIHYFYPYLHLIGDWDAILPEYLSKMETAETGRDYAATILEMMAHVADGHTFVYGHPELTKLFGEAALPIEVRWLEGAPVVTYVGDDKARQAGLAVGDAILAVDGEPVAARMARMEPYVPSSTRQALLDRLCARALLRGASGSTAVLSVQSVDGQYKVVRLLRDPKALSFRVPKTGDIVRILSKDIGYVDLTRLMPADVESMFEKVKETRGMILDMRGYPKGTAWSIVRHINVRGAKIGAQFRRRAVSALSEEETDSGYYFSQPLPASEQELPLYTQPIVMLIDDRAISQAEHTGLFFEAAAGVKLVGTATAGANGDVTAFTLPGGIFVTMTGHEVRHADGRRLQRVGLIPEVEVAPTRAGLLAGKDEVLERGVQVLEELASEKK